MLVVLLPLELQLLEIGKGADRRLHAEFRPARLEHVVDRPEHDRQHLVPLPHLLHQGLHVVLALVPGVDPLLRPRVVRVVRPPVLALVVGLDLHRRQFADPVEQVDDAQVAADEVGDAAALIATLAYCVLQKLEYRQPEPSPVLTFRFSWNFSSSGNS